MVREVAEWFPDYRLTLMADGAYASLAKRNLPRTALYSRMRRNTALYTEAPARQPGQRGRPRKKGTRLVSVQRVLWYEPCPDRGRVGALRRALDH